MHTDLSADGGDLEGVTKTVASLLQFVWCAQLASGSISQHNLVQTHKTQSSVKSVSNYLGNGMFE